MSSSEESSTSEPSADEYEFQVFSDNDDPVTRGEQFDLCKKLSKVICNFTTYSVFVIFTNAFLLSFYAVLAFNWHTPCIEIGGAKISYNYERTFKFGFILLSAETIHVGVARVYLRFL